MEFETISRSIFLGEQHYHNLQNTENCDDIFEKQVERDKIKSQFCNSAGISLISLPYWWDKTEKSLKEVLEEKLY